MLETSPTAESEAALLVSLELLPGEVASLVAEHGSVAAHRLWSLGSIAAAHGLSSSAARGIFPDRGFESVSLALQDRS